MLILVGCAGSEKQQTSESFPENDFVQEKQEKDLKEEEPLEEDSHTDEVYSYLIEDTEKNLISIKMPEEPQYNSVIEEYIVAEIRDTWGETFDLTHSKTDVADKQRDYSEIYLELNATTTFESEEVVSVVVQGLFNKKGTAYPTHWFFAINFNPQTLEKVKFSDFYVVNQTLYEKFSEKVTANIAEQNGGVWPEMLGEFEMAVCSEDSFLSGLESGSVCYYFTENGVGFCCPVRHVLGDYQKAELSYDVLIKK